MPDASWSPLTPPQLIESLEGLPVPVWIAGGIALEIASGRSWRDHDDIDVMVLRRDWPVIREHLADWDIWIADPPGTLVPLGADGHMPDRVHDVWLREDPIAPWRFQIMIDETAQDAPQVWVSRRDSRIRRPVSQIGFPVSGNVRVLAPEIQLFYKARQRREKDEADFNAMLPILKAAQRGWLANAIATAHGDTHDWIAPLMADSSARAPELGT